MQAAQPQGIEAVMAALQSGGQPNGNIGKLPGPVNPQTGITMLDPSAQSATGMPSAAGIPGMQQMGAVDPMAGAMGDVNPEMLQMIIQALMQGGAFNQGAPVG